MKKFIKNIAVLGLILAIITFTINCIFVKWYMPDVDYTNKFKDIPDTLDVCNFGSSHGMYGFNYDDISGEYGCFNFGLTGQSLSYDYRLFQNYSDHIKEGTVVFLTVSYFSFFGEDETLDESFEEKNRRNYVILPPSLIKNYDLKTHIYVKYLPLLGYDLRALIKTIRGDIQDDNIDFFWTRNAKDIDVSADALRAYSRHISLKTDSESGEMIINREEIDALRSLIKGIQDKGAIPILVTTPFLSEYTDAVITNSPDFLNQYYSIIDDITGETGAAYYDYAFDERFSKNYDMFINSDHLSKIGAAEFVDILMHEVVYANGYY